MDIYEDIATRSGGNIYIGVVGPVRTGKSTFIASLMEKLVLPNIDNEYELKRATDDVPQSADGKTVMTTQPKFVPSEAAKIDFGNGVHANVRFVDCVGYIVEGAMGTAEEGKERMVATPWSQAEMPFSKAAEIGTKRVITEHSNIAVLVTTDGSFGELPRGVFTEAEERVVNELKEYGRPFIIVLNTATPENEATVALSESLTEKYGVKAMPVNLKAVDEQAVKEILSSILLEFPIKKIVFRTPKWMRMLGKGNRIIADMIHTIAVGIKEVNKMKEYADVVHGFEGNENYTQAEPSADVGTGIVDVELTVKPELFYEQLTEESGETMRDEIDMFRFIMSVSQSKKQFEAVSAAVRNAEKTGFGVVAPDSADMELMEPVVIKQSGRYGVKLKAHSNCLHIFKTDVLAEVSAIVGSEQQTKYLTDEYETSPDKLWDMNMFGKTLRTLAAEELEGKLNGLSEEVQYKLLRILSRIVNENKKNLYCLLF
ncbi:MAG: stage IV sporulation protein A [Clostridia bacterium]|nr:stage IV sporulation protein A [Clostridia bacterium]